MAYNTKTYAQFLLNLLTVLSDKGIRNGVIIMDNVSFHKAEEVKNLIIGREFQLLYLPAYSSFLNPIENMFSKWKEMVRRDNCRNETELFNSIELNSEGISSEDCNGFFRNMQACLIRCLRKEEIYD